MPTCKIRSWCFTSFENELKINQDDPSFRYCIIADEKCPESGRLHKQGYLELSRPQRLSYVQRLIGDRVAHFERRRGSRTQARDYCRDPEKDGYLRHQEYGCWRVQQGSRSDLAHAKSAIAEGISKDDFYNQHYKIVARYPRWVDTMFARRLRKQSRHFRKVVCKVYWGQTGTGKTKKVWEEAKDDLYVLPLSQNGTHWWDGYEGESNLLIDDFYGGIKYSHLLRILDGHPIMLPVKRSFTFPVYTTVYLTSNTSWDEWYTNVPNVSALRRRITSITHFADLVAPPGPVLVLGEEALP